MKRIIAVFFVIFLVLIAPVVGNAQVLGLQPDKVTVQSGEDVFSSGVTVAVDFTTDNDGIYGQLMFQPEQFWGILGKNVEAGPFSTTLGGSFGHFQGALYIGPYVNTGLKFENKVKFTAMYWPAYFPSTEPRNWRDDNRPNNESVNIGHFGLVGVNIGETYVLRLSYAGLDFLNDPTNWLPGASFTMPLVNQADLIASATWNKNAESWMYALGLSWEFQKTR